MQLHVAHSFLPKQHTVRTSTVMDHFGIDFEQGEHIIADQLDLPISSGRIVLFTGESGSGKSSLMRAAMQQLPHGDAGDPPRILTLESLEFPRRSLIDILNMPVEEAMNLLSLCGLGEAHLMLRTPFELSDGQQYRFRLAMAISLNPDWIVADEFTATLDRTLAKVIAFNVRRLCDRQGIGYLLATTHTDIVDDLAPDVHVRCHLDGQIEINPSQQQVDEPCKKKAFRLPVTSGFPPVPVATGRTSLGGITAVTTSE